MFFAEEPTAATGLMTASAVCAISLWIKKDDVFFLNIIFGTNAVPRKWNVVNPTRCGFNIEYAVAE